VIGLPVDDELLTRPPGPHAERNCRSDNPELGEWFDRDTPSEVVEELHRPGFGPSRVER